MDLRKIKYVVFVLLITLLAGCIDKGGDPDIAFVKFFGEGDSDYGVDACAHNESIYVLANVNASDSVGKQIPCLYFLNKQGESVQEPLKFNIDTIENETAERLLMDNDRNLYIVSNVYTSEKGNIYIRKIVGKRIEWQKSFGHNTNTLAADALISEDDIAIVGSTESSAGFKKFYFLKVSTGGAYIKHVNSGGNNTDDEYLKIIKSNSGFYVTGYSETFKINDDRKRSLMVAKLNSDGVALPEYFGSSRFNEGLCLVSNENSIFIASNGLRTADGIKQMKVSKYTVSNLVEEWDTEFVDNKEVVPVEIFLESNGLTIACNRFAGTAGNICVFSYDINGNYLGKKEFGSNRLDATLLKINRMISVDGEFFLIGSNEFGGNSDVALLKLNSNNVFYE